MIAASEEAANRAAAAYIASNIASSAATRRMARSLSSPHFPGAIFAATGTHRVLCAAAPDHTQWRRLAPLLESCIGKTLSDFPGEVQTQPAQQLLPSLLGGYSPALWCRIRLCGDTNLQMLALDACAQLVDDVIDHADLIAPPPARQSTAQLVALFDQLLEAADYDRAGQILQSLYAGNHLDAANSRFLQLRWLVAQGEGKLEQARLLAQQLYGIDVPREVRAAMSKLLGPGASDLKKGSDKSA